MESKKMCSSHVLSTHFDHVSCLKRNLLCWGVEVMSKESEERHAREQQLKEEVRQAKEAADKAKQEAIKSMENSVLGKVFDKSRNESEQKEFNQHKTGKSTNHSNFNF